MPLSLPKVSNKLANTNKLLLTAIVLINVYILALPFLPKAVFLASNNPVNQAAVAERAAAEPTGQPDKIIIPKLLLDLPFFAGQDESTLDKGLWLRPNGNAPGNGNAVIAGHRFTYGSPLYNFYLLDQLAVGDKITIFWQGQKYNYTVDSTSVVAANQISIETPSQTQKLTLYTCTPIWDPKDRLVVTATPQGARP